MTRTMSNSKYENDKAHTFKEVIQCDADDGHSSGQAPLTILRQVTSLCAYPDLQKDPNIPPDAKQRAERLLNDCCGKSVGSYNSNLIGLDTVISDVTKFIEERDGVQCHVRDVFLTPGATEAMRHIFKILCTFREGPDNTGIFVPTPCYNNLLNIIAENRAHKTHYFLDEENNWGISDEELERAFNEASKISIPRAIFVINPGNPTGNIFNSKCIETFIKFAKAHNLLVLADEVHQLNTFRDTEFLSLKKILSSMGPTYSKSVEIASFMSISKGYAGESGLRGGYCELINICPKVKDQLYLLIAAGAGVPTLSQVALDVIIKPPKLGDVSYELFEKERSQYLTQLKEKVELVEKTLASLPGFTCNPVQGAPYAFPKVCLPLSAIREAEINGLEPDEFYCTKLFEATGICVKPGTEFGQKPNTFHLRISLFPSFEALSIAMKELKTFHDYFLEQYN